MNLHLSIVLAVCLAVVPACTGSSEVRVSDLNSGVHDPKTDAPEHVSQRPVNINTASAEDLQTLPHVGAAMARKIIDHRVNRGPFKRPEELMLIDGISDTRFRRIRHLIRVE